MASRGGDSRKSRRGNGAQGVEWVGGIIPIPGYVMGEGEPHRPDALVWLDADGMVLGTTMARPDDVLDEAAAGLSEAMEHPTWGSPAVPTRVRVASPDLAEALRAGHPGVQVLCAETPELDELASTLAETIARGNLDGGPAYLLSHVPEEACAAFFRAAAGLHRAAPWDVVPSDEDVFFLSIPAFGIEGGALSIIGQRGESFGVVFFQGIEEFEDYIEAELLTRCGGEADLPFRLALNFETAARLPEALLREIEEHGWEIAGEDRHSWPLAADEDLVARPPTQEEVHIGEAIALALPEVLRQPDALQAAWVGGEPVAMTLTVRTHAGDVEVTIGAPYVALENPDRPTGDLLAGLARLAREANGEPIDPDARQPYEDELLRRFDDTPEALSLRDSEPCWFVMDFAADYLGATLPTLEPSELAEIVLEIIPREVVIPPSEAREIIEMLRAFFAFLGREFAFDRAEAFRQVLGGDAVERLERALSDPRKFGRGKSVLMAGQQDGYDVETEEGLKAWLEASQGMPVPPRSRGGPAPAWVGDVDGRSAQKAKQDKKKRKAARKARRKNR